MKLQKAGYLNAMWYLGLDPKTEKRIEEAHTPFKSPKESKEKVETEE